MKNKITRRESFLLTIMGIICFACFACGTVYIDNNTSQAYTSDYGGYTYQEKEHNGMMYGIYTSQKVHSYSGGAITTINLTKDKLEVELLQKQLEKK